MGHLKLMWVLSATMIVLSLESVDAARLSASHREVIDQQIIPAYRLGNPLRMLQTLSPLVPRMSGDEIAQTNKVLEEHGIPPLDQIMSEARIRLLEQNMARGLPPTGNRELLATLRILKKEIDAVLEDQKEHPIMANPLDTSIKLHEFKKLLWEVHVLDNRLTNATQLARYGAQLAKQKSKPKLATLTEADRRLFTTEFSELGTTILQRQAEMEEREIEMRIARIRIASEAFVPTDPSRRVIYPTSYRLVAAYVIGLDRQIVADFFEKRKKTPRPYKRQSLSNPQLPSEITQVAQRATEKAGDLVEKTELLYTGLHWWIRGRYGAGPEAWGMLKSREAMASEQTMFPLYMPKDTPKPTDPMKVKFKQVPELERRHHYVWNAEYRPIHGNVQTNQSSSTKQEVTKKFVGEKRTTHLSRFY